MTNGDGGRPAALAAIGNTPIVRLTRIVGPESAEVWVKLEAANPTGSYKDRMALAMIEGAERRGTLRPGQTVVEYTGGSTGSSLAFVCAVKGYPLRIVTSNAFAAEKLATMRAFGADARDRRQPRGHHAAASSPRCASARAEIAAEVDGYPRTSSTTTTGRRVPRDRLGDPRRSSTAASTRGSSYVGIGGCFVGVVASAARAVAGVRRVAVEPAESAVLSGGKAGTHRIEGGGVGSSRRCSTSPTTSTGCEAVRTEEAFAMARRAAREEGVWPGPRAAQISSPRSRLARELGPAIGS